MISHPDSLVDLANIRHQELQAECACYRRSAQAGTSHRSAPRLPAGTRATLAAVLSGLRIRLQATEIEKLFDVFARINHLEPR